MAATFICVLAVLIQFIAAQVIVNPYGPGIQPNGIAAAEAAALAGSYGQPLAPNGPYGPGLPYAPNAYETVAPLAPSLSCGFGLTLSGLSANGGTFAVTSTSPISPKGLSVVSDNLLYEGPLAVIGQMPFLGTVELEGPLPAAGVGAVAYGCGNGNIGINEELNGVVNAASGLAGPYGPNFNAASGLAVPYGPNLNAANGLAGPYGPNPNVPGFGYNGYGPFGVGY